MRQEIANELSSFEPTFSGDFAVSVRVRIAFRVPVNNSSQRNPLNHNCAVKLFTEYSQYSDVQYFTS